MLTESLDGKLRATSGAVKANSALIFFVDKFGYHRGRSLLQRCVVWVFWMFYAFGRCWSDIRVRFLVFVMVARGKEAYLLLLQLLPPNASHLVIPVLERCHSCYGIFGWFATINNRT